MLSEDSACNVFTKKGLDKLLLSAIYPLTKYK